MPFTLTMPKLSPTMEEGAIAEWHKKEGDRVEAGDLLMEVSTDKATVEYNAIDEGWLRKILVKKGEIAAVNQPIAIFTETKEESIEGYKPAGMVTTTSTTPSTTTTTTTKVATPQPTPAPSAEATRVLASPLAKKLAQEKGVDLTGVRGTGPGGRIMKRDLEKAAPGAKLTLGRQEKPSIPAGSFTEERLTPMRSVIAQRLQEAKATIPHIYMQLTIDAEPLVNFKEQLGNWGVKMTYNDCIIKACAMTLRDHPIINSGFNAANKTIIRFQTIDISVAVNLPAGLITPIIQHADYKSITEIGEEIRALSARAKEGKLQEQEYKGGSFTVSNLGMYGITDFTAIINPPQGAILAVSSIKEVPVVKKGAIVPGKTMHLTLSVDHRVIDGVAASLFLKDLQRYLEGPISLLM